MKESPTKAFLGAAGLVGILAVLYWLLPLWWFAVAAVFLCWEFWTIFNKYPNDTISEIIWRYRKRTVMPLGIGLAIGGAVQAGVFGPPEACWRTLLIGGLLAHFFFIPEKEEQSEEGETL